MLMFGVNRSLRPHHAKLQRQLVPMFPSSLGAMQCQRRVCTCSLQIPVDDTSESTLAQRKGGITPGVLRSLPRKKYTQPIHKIKPVLI